MSRWPGGYLSATPKRSSKYNPTSKDDMRLMTMLRFFVVLLAVGAVTINAQEPDARQVAQERRQAELDAPKLVDVLELEPGMTVADIGSGGGAMTVVLGHWIGSGHV